MPGSVLQMWHYGKLSTMIKVHSKLVIVSVSDDQVEIKKLSHKYKSVVKWVKQLEERVPALTTFVSKCGDCCLLFVVARA